LPLEAAHGDGINHLKSFGASQHQRWYSWPDALNTTRLSCAGQKILYLSASLFREGPVTFTAFLAPFILYHLAKLGWLAFGDFHVWRL